MRLGLALAAASIALAVAGCTEEPTPAAAPPVAVPLSENQRQAAYDNWVDQARSDLHEHYPELEIPEVSFVRFTTPDEYGAAMAECVSQAGFPATDDGSGVKFGAVPPEQAAALAVATFTCTTQFPVDPVYLQPLSSQQLDYLYDYYVRALTPCLTSKGFDVPDIPSRATFVADFDAGKSWTPYLTIEPGTEQAWNELVKSCPQQPAGLFGPGT